MYAAPGRSPVRLWAKGYKGLKSPFLFSPDSNSKNSEVRSGREVMVLNYLRYELNIINYTKENDFIIGEVVTQVTYESDLDKAVQIAYPHTEIVLKDKKLFKGK